MTDDKKAELLLEYIKLHQQIEFVESGGGLEKSLALLDDLLGLNQKKKELDLITYDPYTGNRGEFSPKEFLQYHTISELKTYTNDLMRSIKQHKKMLMMKESKLAEVTKAMEQINDMFGLNAHVNEHFTEAVFDYTMRKGSENE